MSDSTDLAPDEKLCPYCAETIKAAAIRCRFCHSDLTAPVPAAADDDEPTAVLAQEELDDVAATAPDAAARPGEGEPQLSIAPRGWATRLVAGLVALCLVLGAVLGYLVHRSRHPDLDTAPNGQVTANSFRNAAMGAASDAATKVLSYSYKSFDQDRSQAKALMTPGLATQYDKAMDQVAAQTASTKLTLKATVLAAGAISVEKHQAKVLLFVNTVTTRAGSKQQQLDQNRVLMTVTRKDGGWIVSKMDAF